MADATTTAGQTWQELVARKQEQSRNAIPQAWRLPSEIVHGYQQPMESYPHRLMEADVPRRSGILTDREIDITENYTVRALLDKLASGALTSLEVTIAFSKRAAIAQQLTSCLTEIFFDEAQERAKQLDELRSKGKLVGPLHGLPISIKDSFKVVGHDATAGYAAFVGVTATDNSVLVDILLQLGAVLYVKTNIPQTLMSADSQNNVFGRTLNPWNTALTAGGSSGGEGALVAFRGSPLGVGTDVAGSIRIPAFCCGTYGFKPTTGRIAYGNQVGYVTNPGMKFIAACAGPLANDFEALEIFAKAVIDAEPARLDATCFDLPWRIDNKIKGKTTLKIGLLPEDPYFPIHPPVRRALGEAAAKLTAAGHEIIPLSLDRVKITEASEVAWQIFLLDPTGVTHLEKIGEPFIQSIINIMSLGQTMRSTRLKGLEDLERLDRLAVLNVKRQEICEEWRKIWATYGVDAVLAPSAQCTAVPHDTFTIPAYTALLNLLDYPSCVIPFQKVRSELDPEPMLMQPGQYGPNYDPDLLAGAPCSVQVFTNKMRDEECLAAARIVDSCLHA